MKEGFFYFVKNEFYNDFKDDMLMRNKETVKGKEHNRPCYYSFLDNKTGLYWLIPISSKINKYKLIYNKKIEKNKICDTILFGEVLGYEKAFLIQNMFPIIPYYIDKEYVNKYDNKSVTISHILKKELDEKARKVLRLQRKGVNLIFPNVLKIEEKLLTLF